MLSQLMQCVVVQSKAVFQEGSHWHVPSDGETDIATVVQ